MSMNQPIIILGFGRSGTTWISDIISKMYGKLILFEPLHPSVTRFSEDISYATISQLSEHFVASRLFSRIMHKRHKKPWLLRNHVPVKLNQLSNKFMHLIWRQCEIMGFKEIRANFMIDWLVNHFNSKIIFITRHPLAVIASIKRRSNFWEFGWPATYQLFLSRTVYSDDYKGHDIAQYKQFIKQLRSDVERYAAMWAITHAIALPILKKNNLPLFSYEDFYADPFNAAMKLSSYIGNKSISIHPSYLFTPSMTTMKTFHGLSTMEVALQRKGAALFWEDTLSDKEMQKILIIVKEFGITLYDDAPIPQKIAHPKALAGMIR